MCYLKPSAARLLLRSRTSTTITRSSSNAGKKKLRSLQKERGPRKRMAVLLRLLRPRLVLLKEALTNPRRPWQMRPLNSRWTMQPTVKTEVSPPSQPCMQQLTVLVELVMMLTIAPPRRQPTLATSCGRRHRIRNKISSKVTSNNRRKCNRNQHRKPIFLKKLLGYCINSLNLTTNSLFQIFCRLGLSLVVMGLTNTEAQWQTSNNSNNFRH
mmetsp:Transcript_26132/g.54535  ORF Transcript_26132/g.54535 Transcript_26132/m.54535 type:complete len:212 (+) Transcript_26132:1282-1917(+)